MPLMTVIISQESYLEEQNRSVAQIAEERRILSEERTKFHIEQKTIREKLHQDAIKRSQVCVSEALGCVIFCAFGVFFFMYLYFLLFHFSTVSVFF